MFFTKIAILTSALASAIAAPTYCAPELAGKNVQIYKSTTSGNRVATLTPVSDTYQLVPFIPAGNVVLDNQKWSIKKLNPEGSVSDKLVISQSVTYGGVTKDFCLSWAFGGNLTYLNAVPCSGVAEQEWRIHCSVGGCGSTAAKSCTIYTESHYRFCLYLNDTAFASFGRLQTCDANQKLDIAIL